MGMAATDPVFSRPGRDFYGRDVLLVAPDLLGKRLVTPSSSHIISEVEAYRGEEDMASHARFGKTLRNSIMYDQGGFAYIYLIYGIHWMLNIVTGQPGNPQAVLIRGLKGIPGPGLVTRRLGIDRTFHGEDLVNSSRLWIEDPDEHPEFVCTPRIGINYATEPWKSHPWRFVML
jgi:DNA-3-methyladenine glycosylase